MMRVSNRNFLPRRGFWPEGTSLPEVTFWSSQLHRITKQFHHRAGFDGARSATANPAEQDRRVPLLQNRADLRVPT